MTKQSDFQFNFVADIGGTNTRIGLAANGEILPKTIKRFTNLEYQNVECILEEYFHVHGNIERHSGCIAVAGPVQDNIGHMTNLNWSIKPDNLSRSFGIKNLTVLNDLQALGYALKHLPKSALKPLWRSNFSMASGRKLVVGMGTGFNSSVVYSDSKIPFVPPSESGHADLSLQCAEDIALADYIRSEHDFCTLDDVLSGRGLERIYRWQGAKSGTSHALSAGDIVRSLEQRTDSIAEAAVRQFVRIFAVNIANIALTHLPYDGIYLAGGVARGLAPYLLEFGFRETFENKGRFSDFMKKFTVSFINDDAAALIGCANFLELQLFK